MAVTLFVLDKDGLIELDGFATVEAALEDTRRMWMEDEGAPAHYLVRDEHGEVVATLTRPASCAEECVTLRLDGAVPTVERHRCRYLHDAAGKYLGPQVTELAAELVG